MTINIQNDFSSLPFHTLPSTMNIWSPFSLDLLQLIATNPGNHFKCHQIQVAARTFLYHSMVHFCVFMQNFQVFEAHGFIKNALGPMHPLCVKQAIAPRQKNTVERGATLYLSLLGCVRHIFPSFFLLLPQSLSGFLQGK